MIYYAILLTHAGHFLFDLVTKCGCDKVYFNTFIAFYVCIFNYRAHNVILFNYIDIFRFALVSVTAILDLC